MVEGALFTFQYFESVNNSFEFKTDVCILLQKIYLPQAQPEVMRIKFLSLSKMNVVTWSYARMYNITVLENI